MRFRFASWNVNDRAVVVEHLDRLRAVGGDILAFQEALRDFHAIEAGGFHPNPG